MADVVAVVATCNRLNLLNSICLPSILQQTAVPSTVVVVDDSQVGLDHEHLEVRCLHTSTCPSVKLLLCMCEQQVRLEPGCWQQPTFICMLCHRPQFVNFE
jgi:hypothetical protein